MLKKFTLSPARLGWVGFILSLGLIAIALVVGIAHQDLTFDFSGIRSVYKNNPVQWIILTSPFFLTAVFYFLGQGLQAREIKLSDHARHEEEQFHLLETFVEQLGSGNLEVALSNTFDNRSLASKLESFRNKLIANREDEQRRSWEKEGLTRFGDLIRASQNIESLSEDVIHFLVKYTECNQGSVFMVNGSGENAVLQRTACYAYERKKYGDQTFQPGEGLAGQCFLEEETIVLHQVPKNYMTITSGLGEATPSFVVIVPMKTNDQVKGVLEMAAFKKLESHQIRFLERACEAFASVLDSVMTASEVKRLLEDSQQQTTQLRSQEEELRQNLEEMHALQEQMSRQLDDHVKLKMELIAREKVFNHTTILSETDLHGTITYVNEKFCEVSQYRMDELIGQSQKIVRHPDMPKAIFKKMWQTIKNGKVFSGIVKNRKKDRTHYWVDATIVPVIENGKIVRYIGARYHIQDEELAQRMYDEQLANAEIEKVVGNVEAYLN